MYDQSICKVTGGSINLSISKKEIFDIFREENPDTVDDFIIILMEKFDKNKEEINRIVLDLIYDDSISLKNKNERILFKEFLFSIQSMWYWFLLAMIIVYFITTMIPNTSNFIVFRYLFGAVYTLFLPGFALVQVLFKSSQIGDVESAALSIGLSLAVSPSISFLLNFTPWKISFWPVTVSLSIFLFVVASIGLYRKYYEKIQ